MKALRPLLITLLTLTSTCALAASHCRPGEIVYFSCPIKDSEKIVSLCGPAFRDRDQRLDSASVQYRFGKPGQIEITYPSKKSPVAEAFLAEYIVANDRRLYSLMFQIGTYKYEVLIASELQGVIVSGKGRKVTLPCASYPHTERAKSLNDFFQLVEDLAASGGK